MQVRKTFVWAHIGWCLFQDDKVLGDWCYLGHRLWVAVPSWSCWECPLNSGLVPRLTISLKLSIFSGPFCWDLIPIESWPAKNGWLAQRWGGGTLLLPSSGENSHPQQCPAAARVSLSCLAQRYRTVLEGGWYRWKVTRLGIAFSKIGLLLTIVTVNIIRSLLTIIRNNGLTIVNHRTYII